MTFRTVINLSGQVQGVNLRAMIKVSALSLNLKGCVKNEPDGSVKIVLEGEKEKIEGLIRWLNEYRGPGKIELLQDYWSQGRNEFDDFTIKY